MQTSKRLNPSVASRICSLKKASSASSAVIGFLCLIALFLSLAGSGCSTKSDSPYPLYIDWGTFLHEDVVLFDLIDFHMWIDSTGALYQGVYHDSRDEVWVTFIAGLWIGAYLQGEPSANIIWSGSYPTSNYTTKWGPESVGVYSVDLTGILNNESDWPIDHGAPVDALGDPICYGDAMCWCALQGDTTHSTSILSQPITGVRVTLSLYAFTRSDLQNALFIRYEIENLNPFDLDEVYIGFYADTDLGDAGLNATGYNLDHHLSYTYTPDDPGETYVAGFAFLLTPMDGGRFVGTTSHRIMRKNDYIDPDFGEHGFDDPQQVIWALQGLSNTAAPMVDPTTGEETKFAFTGDPVTDSGWIDTPVDVRSLIASGPFHLRAGDTQVVTVVWVVESGDNLNLALHALKGKVVQVRCDNLLWLF
jgi:hypothetical protein